MAPLDTESPDTNYIEMGHDYNDAALVGKHCQYCHQLDFLPFLCKSCDKTFCLDHRSEDAHKCANPGAWARRQRDAELARESLGHNKPPGVIPAQEKKCASPKCQIIINSARQVSVHCSTCNRDYCLIHRFQDDHDCHNLEPLGARPGHAEALQRQKAAVASQTKLALDKLRAWGARNMALAKPKQKQPSAASRMVALNALKKTAQGDAKIPLPKRIYVHVEAEAATTSAQVPKGSFFYSADWVVGRVLDTAAKSLQIVNMNNQSADENNRLRVFHVEGGRLLEFSEKFGEAVTSGNTIVLLRGVGPPPELINL